MVMRFQEEEDAELIEASLYYADRSLEVSLALLSAVDDALAQIV